VKGDDHWKPVAVVVVVVAAAAAVAAAVAGTNTGSECSPIGRNNHDIHRCCTILRHLHNYL
jgi:hypothetical protein